MLEMNGVQLLPCWRLKEYSCKHAGCGGTKYNWSFWKGWGSAAVIYIDGGGGGARGGSTVAVMLERGEVHLK
jgi:hypothetical protein